MFEQASRSKIRYQYKGVCTVEDLWEMPLRALDLIFKNLNTQVKEQEEESLLGTKSPADKILDISISIVKHVVKVRLDEQKTRDEAALKASRKQKLLGIVAEKQDAELRGMSVEDLTKLINEL